MRIIPKMSLLQRLIEIQTKLEEINRNNGVHFTARVGGNHIFIDKSESFFTSYYCRIEYYEHREIIKVKYYDFRLNQFERDGIRYSRKILEDNLELLLEKNINME